MGGGVGTLGASDVVDACALWQRHSRGTYSDIQSNYFYLWRIFLLAESAGTSCTEVRYQTGTATGDDYADA
jgi:hypothetical protein